MLEKMLDTKALAQRFGNDPGYWAKLRCSGDGPEFLKLGKRVYYEESRVVAWLAKRRRTSTSDCSGVHGCEAVS